jgi:hypothetical protein
VTGHRPAVDLRLAGRIAGEGAIVGAVGAVSFAAVHAALILPIWARIPSGMIQAVPVGVGFAWAFDRVGRARAWSLPAHGAAFGAVMFLTLMPGTAFANAMRLAGVGAGGWPVTIATLILAAGSGWYAGRSLTQDAAASRAVAIATVVLTFGASGPVPVVNSVRAAWLFVGFIPICVLAGTVTAMVHKQLV